MPVRQRGANLLCGALALLHLVIQPLARKPLLVVVTARLVDDVGLIAGGHNTHIGFALIGTRFLNVELNVQLGIGMVPQTRNVFPNLTVGQCLEIAATRSSERSLESVFQLFPRLRERLHQKAGLMSGGEQQMLAVGMALITQPGAILLDEPTAGLSPVAARTVLNSLVDVNKKAGVAIVLVEQNVMLTLEIVQRAIVLRSGIVVFDGPAAELAVEKNLWALF